MTGPGARERHGLDPDAAVPAAHTAQLVLDEAALPGQIKMAPAPEGAVMHAGADLPTARAHSAPAPERDTNSDAIGAEEHVGDAGALQRQQAVECSRDPHGFPPKVAEL